jgi:hypothetical protein
MSIGSPLARARSERTARATEGRAYPLALVVGAVLGLAVGCGGGAEHRSPDAAPAVDGSKDVPVSNTDAPQTPDRPDTGMPLKPNGESCSTGGECVSNVCADGVCCNRDCSAACYTCAAPGVMGTCVPSDVGTNPRGLCGDDGLASCGHNGQCDGTGPREPLRGDHVPDGRLQVALTAAGR